MEHNKLRFEDEAAGGDTSGQVVPKSKKRQRSPLHEQAEQPKPSERLRQDTPPTGTADAPPTAGADDAPAGDTTSGQVGPKSKGERKAEKSKLRMERTDEKLTAAKEKLAAQPPPKKAGLIKKLGRATGRAAHGYVHQKIYQVEKENVGTEAAHKVERVGEAVGGAGVRFVKRRHHTRHSRRVQALHKQQVKATANYRYREALQKNPKLSSNPVSRFVQKQRLKRQYTKEAKAAAQKGAGAVKKTAEATGRAAQAVWAFVKSNPKLVLIAVAVLLVVMLLAGLLTMCSSVGTGMLGAVGGTSYLAEDAAINEAELAYTEWEIDLTIQAKNAQLSHRGYDEYRYDIAPTGHDPSALLAFLTAKFNDFTFDEVRPTLRQIFEAQYTLTFTEIVEIRYRTETDTWTDENGETQTDSYEVPYNWYVLETELTARPFEDIIGPLLAAQDESDRYEVYMLLGGNRQYIGSPFAYNWRGGVTSKFGYRVHPITGKKDYHTGLDIAAPSGTSILAGNNGVVLDARDMGSYGLCVLVDYGSGVVARYAHCSALLVRAGQTVEAGAVLALVGSTGDSTGPHLHLEIKRDGELMNPLYFAVNPFT